MNVREIKRSVLAGLLYFIGVFAAGFAFGAIRLMFLVPVVGDTWAVIIETPFILGVSWLFCSRAVQRFSIPAFFRSRIMMGVAALISLLIAEFILWTGMFGNSPTEFILRYQTPSGLIGLVGQFIYASFPAIQIRSKNGAWQGSDNP